MFSQRSNIYGIDDAAARAPRRHSVALVALAGTHDIYDAAASSAAPARRRLVALAGIYGIDDAAARARRGA